ncbi:MAG: 1-deoxy-D-xylulose-5-phosphate reductoisomerase [Candidatus Fimimonas sp.]
MKKVAILGSTGSIGKQTLDVVRAFSDKLKVVSLVAFSNAQLLQKQAEEFLPQYVALISKDGVQCLVEAVKNCDVAVVATRGTVALRSVLYCLQHGIEVALANKETLVCGGELVRQAGKVIPVDSEHSAILQCLSANKGEKADKILLTASGGPFYRTAKEQLPFVTAADALKHPNWNMGAKITVDSATMMNKALEVVEAHFLFGVPTEKIQIVVHRQSVVHSLVQWQSGSVVAQMAAPDMRLPIQLALLGESPRIVGEVDFQNLLTLTFEKCDFEKFPCAKLGYEVEKYPPLCRTVMNGANDVCVENFLAGKLPFHKFYSTITATVNHFAEKLFGVEVTVENIEKCEVYARVFAQKLIDEVIC